MRKLKEESEKEDISINNSETIPKHFAYRALFFCLRFVQQSHLFMQSLQILFRSLSILHYMFLREWGLFAPVRCG